MLVALCFSLPCHAQAPWNKSTSYDRSDVDSDSSKSVSPWKWPASPPQHDQQYRYEVKHPTASKAILLDSPEIRQSNPAEIRYLGNGTEVEVLTTVPDQKIPALSWYRVRVKNGNMRGSVGYISAINIRLMGGPSPSGSQRGGQFSTNSANERVGGTSQASTTNKTGYTMKNSALLLSKPDISKSAQKEFQVGTAVTGTRLELLGVIPDPNITPMKWFYVRMLDGQLAGNTGYVSATNVRDDGRGNPLNTANSRGVTLTEASGSAKSTDSNQYVLKTGALIVTEPKYANVAKKSKQVGFAITGTRLQLLDQAPTADGAMSWRRVLVLSGDMKGREGWVSSRVVGKELLIVLPVGDFLLNKPLSGFDPYGSDNQVSRYTSLLAESTGRNLDERKRPVLSSCRRGDDYTDFDQALSQRLGNASPQQSEDSFWRWWDNRNYEELRYKTAKELADHIKGFYAVSSIVSGAYAIGDSMIRHLQYGNKRDLIHRHGSPLSTSLSSTDKFKHEEQRVTLELLHAINAMAKQGIVKMANVHLPIQKINCQANCSMLLKFIVGGFQGGELYLESFALNKENENGNLNSDRRVGYHGVLRFEYCDDYGAGRSDWDTWSLIPGLQDLIPLPYLYMLHHERQGYKSFTNVIHVNTFYRGWLQVPQGYDSVRVVKAEAGD